MALATSRDQQLAALYEKHQALSTTVAGLTPGSPAALSLQAKAYTIWAQNQQLESTRSLAPTLVLIVLGITALGVVRLLSGH
ncbi:hypothetical protein [Streptomyces sp. TLI_171]|uniref:hypothetical protein n=1 Tax=Streptomyces sp. TLI_171 TaxID=1938859 RepID=UPI000C184BDC|nr:hypothetical protein [Streptomyces sp. TLI_171]RKE02930.1 hypothetical protein BX266_7533 [Streptomyces sp. TLI_171]